MSNSFDTLSQSEKIEFWQNIESKIKEALRQCEAQLPAGVVEEVANYLEHNELGLAWETLSGELLMLEVVPPESAQQMMLEAGICMGFKQAEIQNHVLWKKNEHLIQALWDENEQVCKQAVETLVKIGEPAVPALLLALKNDDRTQETRHWENTYLREAVIRIGEPAFKMLVAALNPHSDMVSVAAKSLALFKDPRAVEPLVTALLDEQVDIRGKCYIIETLGILKDPRAFRPLVTCLSDESGYIRSNAAVALAAYGNPEVIPLIFAALFRLPKADQLLYREDILWALTRFGGPAYEFAVAALDDPVPEVRAVASEVADRVKCYRNSIVWRWKNAYR